MDFQPRRRSAPEHGHVIFMGHGRLIGQEGTEVDMFSVPFDKLVTMTESLEHLCRPAGRNIAMFGNILLNTWRIIIDLCNEVRPTPLGNLFGHASFKRLALRAERDMNMFGTLSASTQAQAEAAGMQGLDVHINSKARINPTGRLRSPLATMHWTYRFMTHQFWHRHLLPFGCYFYENVKALDPQGWGPFINSLAVCKANPNLHINPYSVTMMDVAMLLTAPGYVERLVMVARYIVHFKLKGFNMLVHTRGYRSQDCSNKECRKHITREKYLHLFGALHMTRRVIQQHMTLDNSRNLNMVEDVENLCYAAFNMQEARLAITHFLDCMIINNTKGNISVIQSAFKHTKKHS